MPFSGPPLGTFWLVHVLSSWVSFQYSSAVVASGGHVVDFVIAHVTNAVSDSLVLMSSMTLSS